MRFLKELTIDLPYDPAIALLGIYPKDSDAMKRRDTCTPMFLAAISTIAKIWKKSRCLLTDEQTFFFFKINLFFIGVQFTNIQNNTQYSSHQVPPSVPYDPAIALLGIYPKDTDAMKCQDTCTPMFLAAMSTTATLWKEPWCPSTDDG